MVWVAGSLLYAVLYLNIHLTTGMLYIFKKLIKEIF